MMISKQTIGKFSIVVFLTLLIWVWADLSQDESLSLAGIPININNDASFSSFMVFRNSPDLTPTQFIYLKELVVKGPAGTIQRLKQQQPLKLNLLITPDGSGGAGRHSINLLSFLRDNDNIRDKGVTVESCEPRSIDVDVVSMVSATIPVRCVDETGQILDNAHIEPEQIEAFVPSDWGNDRRFAQITLTADQLMKAHAGPVSRTPYIEVLGQRIDQQDKPVKVSVPETPNPLKSFNMTGNVKLGFLVGTNILDKFRVELKKGENLADLLTVSVQATDEAEAAYAKMPFQVIIEVYETKLDQEVEVKYNFPQEYVRKGEIKLDQQPAHVHLHLVPLTSPKISENN